ncbi:MAG: ribonuclease D, partial [bacterium]|nr:ribonuclease D [bacterium]
MKKYDTTYTFVETQEQLLRFANDIKRGRWIAFDTEFIPEKYYRYKLCVISVAAERGNYILDVIKLDNIDAFLKIVENPKVLKITHAGENDYRILLENYGTKAVNVFDTQLSHGFL